MIGTALAIGLAAASAAGSIGGAAIGAHAAGEAAETQATAAERAAELQRETATEALDWQKSMWNQILGIQQPWLQAGGKAIGELSSLMQPGGQLAQGFEEKFKAPGMAEMEKEPGYQFRLAEGQKIIERSAAAKGNLLTGGTAKAEERYGQDYASGEYSNVYNRAMGEYLNRFTVFNTNQTNLYNRLAGISGAGQTAAGTVSAAGMGTAREMADISMTSAGQQSQAMQNAAQARASGYLTGAGMWGQTVANLGQMPLDLYLMQQEEERRNKGQITNRYV